MCSVFPSFCTSSLMGAFLFVKSRVCLFSYCSYSVRIGGQGAPVRLGWSARPYSFVLCSLPRRNRSGFGFFRLLTLLAPPLGGHLACGVYRLSRVNNLLICCRTCIVLLGGQLVAFFFRFRIVGIVALLFRVAPLCLFVVCRCPLLCLLSFCYIAQ